MWIVWYVHIGRFIYCMGAHIFLSFLLVRKCQDIFHWSEADHDTFNSVIKLMPDTAPCDLAVICRKPCIEVCAFPPTYFHALSSQKH